MKTRALLLAGIAVLSLLNATSAHAGEGDWVCGKHVMVHTMPDTVTIEFTRPPRNSTVRHTVEFSQKAVRAADGTIFSGITAVKLNGKRCEEGE